MPGRDLPPAAQPEPRATRPSRPRRRARVLLACLVSLSLALTACGDREDEQARPLRGGHLTIYSSLPHHGPDKAIAADVLAAQQLALAQDGGRAGRYRIRLVVLDAATPQAGASDPSQISENARRAAQDLDTVAYLGEISTGSSAISIPLLNEVGILEVSPLDTAMTLTTGSVAVTGSPERFYPKLDELGRTFARVVPSDRTQADALVGYMRFEGVRRLAILTDEDPSGRALATRVRWQARVAGIAVVASEEVDGHAREHDATVARVVETRPDALLDATGRRVGAARLWRELAAADPGLRLFGPASLADAAFITGLGPAAPAARLTGLLAGSAGSDGSSAAGGFARAFAARTGHTPTPEAAYGYEAMRGVLAAIRRAVRLAPDGRLTRAAVVHEFFLTRLRDGVLGPYEIDASGDTSLRRWGAFRVAGGELRLVRALEGARDVAANAGGSPSGQR